jgi:hypothetical protein
MPTQKLDRFVADPPEVTAGTVQPPATEVKVLLPVAVAS